jgi:hypothetical protein
LQVTNSGQEDLSVSGSSLENTDGQFTLKKAPSLVTLGASEDLIVEYTAAGDDGDSQSTGVKLQTDDPDNEGILRATVTAIVVAEPVASAKTECGPDDDVQTPCEELNFGSTQINGAGVTLQVKVINDGNADMHISFASVNHEAGEDAFAFDPANDAQIGSTVVAGFPADAITLPPGRSADCGAPSGTDANVAVFNIHYVPTELGGDTDTFVILTDAVGAGDGGEIDVPLLGAGTDIGILMTPDVINFGQLGEGDTLTIDVNVENVGTSQASVNDACIDLENDGTCEAGCTGQASDNALNGTLTCKVTKLDDSLESRGFVLAGNDITGTNDERNIAVTWTPAAGADRIPTTAVLALHSNILGNRIFTAPLIGGSVGILTASTTDDCAGTGHDADVCVIATGDPADFHTWHGTATIRLENTGSATVNLGAITIGGDSGIVNDYAVSTPAQTALAPGDHVDVTLTYDEATGGDAGPSQEIGDIEFAHDGAGGVTTVVIDAVPPT